MTAPVPGRASALYRRAMENLAPSAGDTDPRKPALAAPAPPRSPTLPGAGPLAVALIGLILGLSGTAVVIARGWAPGAVTVGPWVARPRVGTTAIDPYARASLARSGAVPLAASEGLSFTATTDDTGYRLVGGCAYRLSGGMPPARFWTLTATDRNGRTFDDDPARRSAFTSTEVVRDAGGHATIEVGPRSRPGNWLALSGEGPLTLTLRLYDTPLTGNPSEIAGAALPGIARQSCGGGS